MQYSKFVFLFFGFLLNFYFQLSNAAALDACNFAIPSVMPGVNFYSNPYGFGDTVDPVLLAEHQRQMKGVEQFVFSSSNALDRPISWIDAPKVNAECIRSTLTLWAKNGALLLRPSNSGAQVGRVMYTVGLNIIAAKLAYRGKPVSREVILWLQQLTYAVINDYKNFRFHGYFNNVNAWTGTAAATFLAVSKSTIGIDKTISDFERQSWNDTLGGIVAQGVDKGLVPSEMTRGKNSLSYTLFYYGAMLLHREARRSLGYIDQRYEFEQVRAVSTKFGELFCRPASDFFRRVGTPLTSQEESDLKTGLATYGFRVPDPLMEGTLKNDMFKLCPSIPVSNGYIEKHYGGDTRYIRSALMGLNKDKVILQ